MRERERGRLREREREGIRAERERTRERGGREEIFKLSDGSVHFVASNLFCGEESWTVKGL